MCSFSQNGPIFVKFPVIFLQLFVPDPDRFQTCRLDLRLDRAELSLACGSRCGSNGKAARQGPAARLWIQEFESSLGMGKFYAAAARSLSPSRENPLSRDSMAGCCCSGKPMHFCSDVDTSR
jgi:hypothetical protein